MQSALVALLAAAACLPAQAGSRAAEAGAGRIAVTPIQKVIQMLNGMLTKGKSELHDEQVQFAAYKQFCDDSTTEKQRAIADADKQITMLQADIEFAETESENLARTLREIDANVATWSGDIKAAQRVRELEKTDYMKVHTDYTQSLDAIEEAIRVIKAQQYNRPQAVSLLTAVKSFGKVPKAARRVIDAFLAGAQEPEIADVSAPEAHAYESQSSSITDMLEKLLDKFTQERSTLEKEEMSRRHAHEMLVADLQQSVKNAEETRANKVQQRAKQLQTAAEMKGTLTDTTSTKADDAKYLSGMTASCSQKSTDFEDRQKLRRDEITAIEQAIEILSSDKIFEPTSIAAMLQRKGAVMFVQTGSKDHSPDQMRLAAYLHERANEIHSAVLSALAVRVLDDPFSKVKKMIQDLITRLEEEANEETQHKGWCDKEVSENEAIRTSRATQVEGLSSEIDEKNSLIAKLTSEIQAHSEELSTLNAEVAEATQLRSSDKKENEATIKDAQEAQVAVQQAIQVLKKFYREAGESTALLQHAHKKSAQGQEPQDAQQPPAIFDDTPYKGMQAENGGVIGMLEVIEADYARLESTTAAMETTAESDFNRQMTESAVNKAQLEGDIEHKTRSKGTHEGLLLDLRNDLSSAQKELDAANNYYEKLKPSCLDAGMTFEERTQRRKEEIESLREALRILNGEDIAALQELKRARR